MQVEALSLSLSPQEVVTILMGVPLPKGITLSDITLRDSGLEATVRASFLLNIPVKFKAEIQSYAGARVYLKVTPPIKPNWLVVRPMIMGISGAAYAGNSLVELDLMSLSKGYLSSLAVQKIVLNKSGFRIDVSSAKSSMTWEELLAKLS